MSVKGTLTADGSTPWVVMTEHGHIHIKCVNEFGAGTITIQDEINDTAYDSLDSSDVAITKTDDFDAVLYFGAGDRIRLNLSGSSSPTIYWKMSGPVKIDY